MGLGSPFPLPGFAVQVRAFERFQPIEQRLAHQRVAEVDAGAIAALRTEELRRQDDLRVPLRLQRLQLGDRVADQLVDRHLLVGYSVDEARIGAVLEEPADEIGEQLLVAADRRVNSNWRLRIAEMAFELGEFLVKLLAHAVQALELERPAMGERLHLSDRVRIMGRESGIDDVARPPGASSRRRGRKRR